MMYRLLVCLAVALAACSSPSSPQDVQDASTDAQDASTHASEPCQASTFWVDQDHDHHGALDGGTIQACDVPDGYAPVADDCQDNDWTAYPDNPLYYADPVVGPDGGDAGYDHNCDGRITASVRDTWPDAGVNVNGMWREMTWQPDFGPCVDIGCR
jgi:hypothetical protein